MKALLVGDSSIGRIKDLHSFDMGQFPFSPSKKISCNLIG